MSKKLLVPCLALFAVVGLVAAGCSNSEEPAGKKVESNKTASASTDDGWWCVEHGIPEHDCALCDQKVAASYKAKSDWCKEHDRPESQCFICHPEKEAGFAALYEARYGKKPPKPDAAHETEGAK